MKHMQARCVLISDSSQACNGTVVSSAAAQSFASAADAVAECQTGGSIRLALIAVAGFIVIPIPLLLLYVDGRAGHAQALAFARQHGHINSLEEPVESTGSVNGDCASRSLDIDTEKNVEFAAFEMTIHRPDCYGAPAAMQLPPQQ